MVEAIEGMEARGASPLRESLRRLRHDRAAFVGAILLLIVLLAAFVGPFFAKSPTEIDATTRLAAPSAAHRPATDALGRDLLSRVLGGLRASLSIAFASVTVAGAVGVAIGVVAGLKGGKIDTLLMRIMDVLFAFPAILLALLLVALLGSNVRNLVIAISIVYIPTFARIARGSTMNVVAQPFVEASRSIGATDWRLISRHIRPNIIAPLIVQFTVSLAFGILVEASLSFLGLEIQPPTPSLGNMLSTGKTYLEISPWPAL